MSYTKGNCYECGESIEYPSDAEQETEVACPHCGKTIILDYCHLITPPKNLNPEWKSWNNRISSTSSQSMATIKESVVSPPKHLYIVEASWNEDRGGFDFAFGHPAFVIGWLVGAKLLRHFTGKRNYRSEPVSYADAIKIVNEFAGKGIEATMTKVF